MIGQPVRAADAPACHAPCGARVAPHGAPLTHALKPDGFPVGAIGNEIRDKGWNPGSRPKASGKA